MVSNEHIDPGSDKTTKLAQAEQIEQQVTMICLALSWLEDYLADGNGLPDEAWHKGDGYTRVAALDSVKRAMKALPGVQNYAHANTSMCLR